VVVEPAASRGGIAWRSLQVRHTLSAGTVIG
jgi:hypothetical protein